MNKQKEILRYLITVESATIADIVSNMPFGYFHNSNKYIGEIMSRMVKNGSVERVSRGVFKIKHKASVYDEPSLFKKW